eukprot:CAMPEP_0202961160 /NCGR_PEP_ID=MMETSP1396-20130829/5220_1 /ASSEMBLY_ACC=CAM_ASM_000872 /TAXON_ID= /ORGANISM="Pseudokeronopsis sp., Strain Brazil" /LENGTH=184 /DNA_ID=CAMNT_0049680777 /DNA_START=226 /DNA_END=780 /DNA_ORIENTATION=+
MIAFANQQKKEGDEITYIVQDLSQPLELGMQFDIVFAWYFFQYAKSYEMLVAFARNAYNAVKPGGKVYCLNAVLLDNEDSKKCVGVDMDSEENAKSPMVFSIPRFPPVDFDTVDVKYYCGDHRIHLNYFSVYPETIKKAFQEVGFSKIDIPLPMLKSPDVLPEHKIWVDPLPLDRIGVYWHAEK